MSYALSIITICFQNPKQLEATLESLDGLPVDLFEIIIIDGSTDDSCSNVAKRFPGFFYFQGHDTGKYNAMNKGVALARGDAVLFMNSGDCLHDRVALHAAIQKHRNKLSKHILYGDSIRVVANEKIYVKSVTPSPKTQRLAEFPSHQSILIPTAYHSSHLYDEKMFFAADGKMLRSAFDRLPCIRLDFAIGEFSYGGVSTSPGSWLMLVQQYREQIQVVDYVMWEKLKFGMILFRRKVAHMLFGEKVLQLAQARRIKRKIGATRVNT